jgi:hypothetical protein
VHEWVSKSARDLRLAVTVPAVRLWFALRRTVGWPQASRKQRFTVSLGALCALSIVTGGALAAAGVGKAGPFAPTPAASANRGLAAAWIVQQVSPGVTVSCDPAMCGQLRADGFPAARLKPLAASARGPLSSGLIVSTPAVRDQFGASLAAAYAPLVIAGFGSGAGRVDVRVVAPDGAAAFKAQLAAEHASLVSAGRQLLQDQSIQASPAARSVLLSGRVDSRLFATLSVLAGQLPLQLTSFGDLPPGASAAVPPILAFLHAQQGAYRPAMVSVTRSASGQSLVTVRFDAPGLMGTGAS